MKLNQRKGSGIINSVSRSKRLCWIKLSVWSICTSFSTCALSSTDIQDRLWLPAKYKMDMPKLLAAAQVVESSEPCKKLVRGELLQSSSPQMVFRILCRNEQNQTYVTLVDGDTLELVNLSGETRLEQHQRHIAQFWRKCRDSLQRETEAMINTRWPETRLLQPSIMEDQRILFEVKFTAENLAGDTLYYLGTCDYAGLSNLKIKVKPRL